MMSHIVGIDVGTSVVKAVLFDQNGQELQVFSEPNTVNYPRSGWAECDMQQVWSVVRRTLAAVTDYAGQRSIEIRAIGITGQGDGTWLIDAAGYPVGPAIIWLDGRAGDDLNALQRKGIDHKVFDITGTMLNTSHQGMQLRWLRDNNPALLAKGEKALRAKDWVFFCLTGEIRTDYTDASHSYFDARANRYSDDVLELLEITEYRHLLPVAVPCYENRAPIKAELSRALGISDGVTVFAGPLDVAASDLGVGSVSAGDACSILGTAGIHQLVVDEPLRDPAYVGYTMSHAPAGTWIRCLPSMTGTLNLEWFLSNVYSPGREHNESFWAEIEQCVYNHPLGANGVIYHPFIDSAGERAPFVKPTARAQFSGLSATTSITDMLRAVFEGVALSTADCYDHLARTIQKIRLAGGGARSDTWAQMVADAVGAPVETVTGKETGARGAAINAMVGIGMYPDFVSACDATVNVERIYHPDLGRTHHIYRELLAVYRETYEVMFPVWDRRHRVIQQLFGGKDTE